ncbi:antitoxin Phd [Nocardia sp. NPDC019395]|uniref:antitoxin Phd n=1 Tax=Nocardia sp. NPDC019395 TaxID=3154686 RepID=UPI0033D3490C
MADLTVRFDEDEFEALRRRAELEGQGTRQFVHDVVMSAVHEHSGVFRRAADHVAGASEELNRRLA